MLQGEIALHSGDVAIGETDPAYGATAHRRVTPSRATSC